MRSSTLIFAFAASQAVAQSTVQSKPFNLVLSSSNKTLDGALLGACHEGAAIEGLCVDLGTPSPSFQYNQYTFNTTAGATPIPNIGITGLLVFALPTGGSGTISSALEITPYLTSNVAVPLFFPGADAGTQVGFDKDNKLFVPQYYDDTVVPPKYDPTPLYRWYVCTTDDNYVYTTLAWVVGTHSPENPSCQKVQVTRVFV